MENFPNKVKPQKIRSSASSLNFKSKNPQAKFVILINNLSSDIKSFYLSIKKCLNDGKQNIINKNDISSLQTYNLIDKYLFDFISKAKNIFKRMKYMQKINLIQEEINSYQNQNQNMNINFNNQNNFYMKSNFENKIINQKKLFDDDIYIPSLCNNTNNSFHINKLFQKINTEKNKNNNINHKFDKNDMIKSMNNSSKDIILINKYDNTFNIENKSKNHHSANKIIYNNYNRKHNNLKRNNNVKSVINLRKKIIFDKKTENSSYGLSSSHGLNNININSNINSSNCTQSNFFQSKKDIFDGLHVIISLLKEIKLIKGNIFTKSIEAEKHKKVLKKIYNELIKLIKNIFKDNNININSSLDIINKDDKFKKNSSFNRTYNYRTLNNDNSHKNINYKKEIKYRDLIIQQLKDELNTKSQKHLSINNKDIFNEENNKKNKSKKLINDLQEKIEQNKKKNINNINSDKNMEIIKQRFTELEQEKEQILMYNEELKNHIIKLNQELDITKKNICINPIYKDLITQNFSFAYQQTDIINEKAQKIIDELNQGINTYKEQNDKAKEEIEKLNEEINKNKEEIVLLNNDINKYKEDYSQLTKTYNDNINENKKLKENIDELNSNIEKYKKIISYQEEELKNVKDDSQNRPKSDRDSCHSLSLKESLIINLNNNIITTEERKSKKRNNSKINEYQMEQDKIYLKYELLKNDYNKLNTTLIQKQKLLDNYSKLSNETASKTNIDEQILELMAQHKKEIEALTQKYNKNIINLKMNLPSPYSPETHTILIDKRYAKYDLKWYLLTVLTEKDKNYENTFWVSDFDMKPLLEQFNKFKTEKELEDEKFDNLYKMQEKWLKQLDEKEKKIEQLKEKLDVYENNHTED